MKAALNAVLAVLVMLYPLGVYFGLNHFSPRWLGLILLVLLVLRTALALRGRARQMRALRAPALLALGLVGSLGLVVGLTDSEPLLRLYPALMSLAFLAVFAHSLVFPPSLIERLARLGEPDLPAEGVRYTRSVTGIWCGFFVVNGAIAAWAALYASREFWALYTGGISYALMGLLFAGEWLVRQKVRRRYPAP